MLNQLNGEKNTNETDANKGHCSTRCSWSACGHDSFQTGIEGSGDSQWGRRQEVGPSEDEERCPGTAFSVISLWSLSVST